MPILEFRQYAEIVSGLLTVVAVRVPCGKEVATVSSHLVLAGRCIVASAVFCMPWLRDTKMEEAEQWPDFLLLCPVDGRSPFGGWVWRSQQPCAVYDPGALMMTV